MTRCGWPSITSLSSPAPTRRDVNSACSAVLPAQATPLRSMGGKTDCASIRSSMQTGSNTSPDLLASVVAGSHGEETTSHSFPRRPFLLQFAIDVAAVLVAFTLILATGFGLGFAVFAVLFLSF